MDFGLNELQREIQGTAGEMLANRAPLAAVRATAEAGGHDQALWTEIVELGWSGIAVPEEYGGAGLGMVELSLLAAEHGYAVASTPLLGTALLAALLAESEREDLRRELLPRICAGEVVGAIGEGDEGACELLLDGAPGARVVLIEGEDVLLVEGEATPLATIDLTRRYGCLDGARGERPGGSGARLLDRARVLLAAELVGISQRALDLTVAYVSDRRQFGVPVGSFQAVANRCAAMLRQVETARSAVYAGAWAVDAADGSWTEAAALAKAAASVAGREVTGSAIQAHGGVGFTWEADLHWLFKRAQLDAHLFGGPSVQLRLLGGMLAA
jgi:alkylation response protein AidB-like acyl-CoA dehydrogenase